MKGKKSKKQEKEIVASAEENAVSQREALHMEEDADSQEGQGQTRYIKRVIKYRINPETGEKEIIDEPVEHVSEEPISLIKEEIIEVPSNEAGKRRYVKRIIRSIIRVNPNTGEKQIVEGEPIEEIIENIDQPIRTVEEELIELPLGESGRKKFVKKVVRYITKINAVTGEREVIIEGQQIQQPTVSTTTREVVEESSEEAGKARYIKRVVRYRINPETGEKERVEEPQHVSEEPMTSIREEIVDFHQVNQERECLLRE